MTTPYEILGVSTGAEDDEIKQAYLNKIRGASPEKDTERFQMINTAYERIKTRRDRARYDLFEIPVVSLSGILANHTIRGKSRRPSTEIFLQALRASRKPWSMRDIESDES